MSALETALEGKDNWKKHPWFNPADIIYSDYTYFYVTIIICSIFASFLLVLNIAFCYCSPHRSYWRNRHTGNRFITSLWISTPHNNPPIDLTELEEGAKVYQDNINPVVQYREEEEDPRANISHQPQRYQELLQKRESDI